MAFIHGTTHGGDEFACLDNAIDQVLAARTFMYKGRIALVTPPMGDERGLAIAFTKVIGGRLFYFRVVLAPDGTRRTYVCRYDGRARQYAECAYGWSYVHVITTPSPTTPATASHAL